MDKLLIICGPTATGKTAIAAALAKKFNGELISADSRQVYRGMDLVTGKDRPNVPIWLYDVVNPDEEFSVSHWVKLAKNAISDIQKRNKLPIVVGGTGLYIHALLNPLETIDVPRDSKLRVHLSAFSKEQLQQKLQTIAPSVWQQLNFSDRNNPRRLTRKIEIAQSTTVIHKEHQIFNYLFIGLTAPLPVLDERIDRRFAQRVQQGMNEEIHILTKKYTLDLPSMSAIGLNEHAYARRQMTWFKKMPSVDWVDITEPDYQDAVAEKVTRWYTGV
jgi:tRNA dimethylallyltransferase